MASGKEVRLRIASVKSTMQITKAMKMVSAAKLRRATERIVQIRPYAEQLNNTLVNIVSNLGGEANISFAEERQINKVLIVIVSSDKGLCGGFNANVVKAVKSLLINKYADLVEKNKVELLFIGKKANDAFKTFKGYQNKEFMGVFATLTFEEVSKVAQWIMDNYNKKEYDRVEVVYNQFKNAAVQYTQVEQFLPIATATDKSANKSVNYIFEPSQEEILTELVPKILKTQFYRYTLDSNASDHGARMTAMDKATENANELLKNLTIQYNRARQAAITTELSEIVSGAAALSNG
jgi:F-type H+-transporting ATPase subunit gamma